MGQPPLKLTEDVSLSDAPSYIVLTSSPATLLHSVIKNKVNRGNLWGKKKKKKPSVPGRRKNNELEQKGCSFLCLIAMCGVGQLLETKESMWLLKSKKKESPVGYLLGLVASLEPPSTGGGE